ncbi:ubiquitin C-terminal hydrolase Ubp14 [Kickxella alabastrina]|uniref:Ubiquitin C-terminal hydrolase Ubp14 n=1 Tax=Kickxella alabastrina TaxID=61397 RepID=A0ACC1IUW1_9FUNG|nr:ubiquitin C-terminal hydrolase Ubp14 [Kickxella alabastrina]
MAICEHALNSRLTPPSSSTPVYKEECTQCFDNQDMEGGIEVCLSCFNGGCPEGPHNHAQQHSMRTGHYLTLNIRRIAKAQSEDDQRPAKQTKLEIREESDIKKHEYQTYVRCWGCSGARVEGGLEHIEPTVQAVIHAVEASKGNEIKAWSEEVTACEHFNALDQSPAEGFGLDKLHRCGSCDKHENLWLCLVCGHVGCGRRQYDGSGGNNHAIDHFESTGHKVSIKLGTITPEGTADAYCYLCDDNKVDPSLSSHLHTFGINVSAQQKTEKSVAELQLEQNLKFDFNMTTADGTQLQPVAGPGLTGLRNLGNSCYMASVLQCVFGIDRFRDRYFPTAAEHFATCTQARPAQCVLCQLHKLADGLWSGRYAILETNSEGQTGHQRGIPPAQFKAAIAKDHYEFSTMRQQDAFEFLQHLAKQVGIVERTVAGGARDPTKVFDFSTEERLQCTGCQKVRYKVQRASSVSLPAIKRTAPVEATESGDKEESDELTKSKLAPVTLKECLDLMSAAETVDGYNCPHCQRATTAIKSTRFATFPKVMAMQVRRFELVNWVPQKLDIPVQVPLDQIDLDSYRGRGIQPGEEPLPETDESAQGATSGIAAQPEEAAVDEETVSQLESMGFPRVRCVKAVKKTGNCGAEAAMNWIFEHMDDADIDVPEESSAHPSAASAAAVDPEAVEQLMAMGFSKERVEKELTNAGGDPNRALDRLLNFPDDEQPISAGDVTMASPSVAGGGSDDSESASVFELTGFVSHKGSSVHCGHYIANVRQGQGADTQWFLFNDSKVVAQSDPEPEQAYIFFFTRND